MRHELPPSPVTGVRWAGRTAVLDVAGEIDLSSSPRFLQALLSVLDEAPERIVVNLSGVRYMDSAGVASLVKVLSRTRKANVPLVLAAMSDRVRGVFEITRLDTVFDIRATEQEALA